MVCACFQHVCGRDRARRAYRDLKHNQRTHPLKKIQLTYEQHERTLHQQFKTSPIAQLFGRSYIRIGMHIRKLGAAKNETTHTRTHAWGTLHAHFTLWCTHGHRQQARPTNKPNHRALSLIASGLTSPGKPGKWCLSAPGLSRKRITEAQLTAHNCCRLNRKNTMQLAHPGLV